MSPTPLVLAPALRQLTTRTARPILLSRAKRTYASSAEHTDPSPPTKNNLPLIAVGCVFAAVPFYYFYHSGKAPNSEKQAMAERRKTNGGPGQEFRDVRDSPIKTLEDKKRRDGSA